jgi:hypothetical protein
MARAAEVGGAENRESRLTERWYNPRAAVVLHQEPFPVECLTERR